VGIILRQSIKGTIYTYFGAFLGFINVAVLMQYFLAPEEVGLVNLLVAISVIFAQFSSLGFNQVTTRLFSYFRNKGKKHNGFLFLAVSTAMAGYLVMLVIFFLIKPYLISKNAESSPLFVKYILFLIPLIFFYLFFTIFDNYAKVLYNSTIGIFLKEIFVRIITLGGLLGYAFDFIGFNVLVFVLVSAQCVPALVIVIYLIREGQFNLNPDFSLIDKKMRKQITGVAAFGLLSNPGAVVGTNIDKYMVNNFMDLGYTGIYSIAYYFGTLIIMPSRALIKVSSAVLADAWKKNDIGTIYRVYFKSCLNQFIVALILVLLLTLNMNNILEFLDPKYRSGIMVIIIIAVANMIEMISGTSGILIQTSKYYPFITYLRILVTVVLVGLQILLIPRYGINGAAWAFLVTKVLSTLVKFIYILYRFRMQPFKINFVYVILAGLGSIVVGYFLPQLDNYIVDLVIRSILITSVYGVIILLLKASEDINGIWIKTLAAVKRTLGRSK
jgi:O-antigen/teichoic acid export membrane protein